MENLPVFHDFFRTYLLPVQLRHGARLVGRWETEDGRVVAIWEYDDLAAYERIQAAVRADPGFRRAQEQRAQLPSLITTTEEVSCPRLLMHLKPTLGINTSTDGTHGSCRADSSAHSRRPSAVSLRRVARLAVTRAQGADELPQSRPGRWPIVAEGRRETSP
jgi:NIPSNAP protein